jgi:ADP-heptose:LPS heptosyltransferase
VLHIGASTTQKRWPSERWRALAEALTKDGLAVVLSGGKGEETLTATINHRTPSFIDLAGRLNLPQLWHLLANAQLLVCPDTGIAHLGRIVGVPTVTLFGPGSALLCGTGRYWADASYRAVFTADMPCRDETRLFRREVPWVRRCGRGDAECAHPHCMDAIDANAVLATCRTVLASHAHAS